MGLHSGRSGMVVTSTTAGSTLSGASTVSGLTAPTALVPSAGPAPLPAAPAVARPGSTGVRVENTHFNSTLFGPYQTSTVKSKVLRQKIERGELPPLPPSKLDSSKPVCLAWHTKGQCNTLCPCTADHVAYSLTEYEPLATWCREHGYAAA